jgi:hypothetical protein
MVNAAIGTHQAMMTLFEALFRLACLCRDVARSGDGGKAGETQGKGEGPGGTEAKRGRQPLSRGSCRKGLHVLGRCVH